jgi:hypothetical protein
MPEGLPAGNRALRTRYQLDMSPEHSLLIDTQNKLPQFPTRPCVKLPLAFENRIAPKVEKFMSKKAVPAYQLLQVMIALLFVFVAHNPRAAFGGVAFFEEAVGDYFVYQPKGNSLVEGAFVIAHGFRGNDEQAADVAERFLKR